MAYVLWNVVARAVDDFHLEINVSLSHCEESHKSTNPKSIIGHHSYPINIECH
jgi:hypothetical protein